MSASENRAPQPWGPIDSLGQSQGAHLFPTAEVFSGGNACLAAFAKAISASLQIPESMVVPLMLAGMSHMLLGRVKFHGSGSHVEPPAIWVMAVAPSGSRKTAALESVIEPVRQLLTEMPGGNKPPDIVTDVSEAALFKCLRDDGAVGVFSDEGDFLNRVAADVYLKGWSAGTVSRDRIGSIGGPIEGAEVCLGLAVQPTILAELLGNSNLVGRGFAQRMLLSIVPYQPKSYERQCEIPCEVLDTWKQCLKGILGVSKGSVLRMSPDALISFNKAAGRIEALRKKPFQASVYQGWLDKAHGQMLRVAGILALAKDPAATQIDVDSVRGAAQAIAFFEREFKNAISQATLGCCVEDEVQRVVQWFKDAKVMSARTSTIQQGLRRRRVGANTAEDWQRVFNHMVQSGAAQLASTPSSTLGGRPSQLIYIHPELVGDDLETLETMLLAG